MTSHIALLPEKDVAVVALTNQQTRASRAVTSQILNAYLSQTPQDWVELYASGAAEEAEEARKTVEEALANRDADSTPTLPLSFMCSCT